MTVEFLVLVAAGSVAALVVLLIWGAKACRVTLPDPLVRAGDLG